MRALRALPARWVTAAKDEVRTAFSALLLLELAVDRGRHREFGAQAGQVEGVGWASLVTDLGVERA